MSLCKILGEGILLGVLALSPVSPASPEIHSEKGKIERRVLENYNAENKACKFIEDFVKNPPKDYAVFEAGTLKIYHDKSLNLEKIPGSRVKIQSGKGRFWIHPKKYSVYLGTIDCSYFKNPEEGVEFKTLKDFIQFNCMGSTEDTKEISISSPPAIIFYSINKKDSKGKKTYVNTQDCKLKKPFEIPRIVFTQQRETTQEEVKRYCELIDKLEKTMVDIEKKEARKKVSEKV